VIPHFSAITIGAILPSTSLTLDEVNLVRSLTNQLIIYRNRAKSSDGSYIILTSDGNIEHIDAENSGLIVGLKYKFIKIWNSESRFVVPGANVFSMSQQNDIFYYFSKFRIYNCITVSKESDVIHKEYSRPTKVNEVRTGMKFEVYTWFPYQSSDRCTRVNYITLLDSWVISAQGHFTKNTDLFPRMISSSFNRCPRKAVVYDRQWYFATNYINITHSNGTVVTYIEGLEMVLLSIVLQQMNMTFIHVPIPENFKKDKICLNNLVNLCL